MNKCSSCLLVLIALVLLLAGSLVACGSPSPVVESLPTEPSSPSGEVIPWNHANFYVGKIKVVEGPVVDSMWAKGSKEQDTFLNIGAPYPQPNRFTVVILIDDRGKFTQKFPPDPETHLLNKTVRVRGYIDTYRNGQQIQLSNPSDIWIVE